MGLYKTLIHPTTYQHQQCRGIAQTGLKWVKSRSSNHVIDPKADCLLKEAIKRSSSGFITVPVPRSALLASGKVDPMHPETVLDSLGMLRPPGKLSHQLLLVSAYSSFARMGVGLEPQSRRLDPATNVPLFTICTRDFTAYSLKGALREGYHRGKLLNPHPLVHSRDEYYHVMRTRVLYRGKGMNFVPPEDILVTGAQFGTGQVESEGNEEEVKEGKGGDEFYGENGSGEDSDKMRCPQLERGFEDLALPTSRQLIPHELHRRGPSPMNIAHAGVGIFTLGVVLSNSMKTQFTQRLPLGSELNLGKERIILRGLDHLYGPTYHSICGNLMIYKPTPTNSLMTNLEHNGSTNILPINFPVNDKLEHFVHRWIKNHEQQHFGLTMFPEKRFYQQGMTTTEVAIHTNLLTDFYALIGTGSSSTGGWYVTIMKLPFIFLVFIGFAVGAAGGFLRLFRLLRLKKLQW